ncbi:hypothetical protein CHF27_012870, partial [Romboutsia maritimum]
SSLGMNKHNLIEDNKIYKNIYIQNVDVGGSTLKEAKDKINNKYKLKPMKIIYKNKFWNIKPEEIDLNYNIEKALNEAYLYTRSNDKLENLKRYINLTCSKKYNINLQATYNEYKLSNVIQKISSEIDVKVKQASLKIKDSGEFVITSSKEGIEVDFIKLKEIIYNMILNKNIKDINLPINVIKPHISTEDIKSIDSILGQYSTSFNDHSARGENIYIAGESTSDIIIMPQDVFSYNKSTGERTWTNGYKTSKIIVGGKYVNGEGGGVCQVSTTIYNAALLSGLQIEEVHNHTFPSRYAPRGRDAAVSYGYIDLKFKNPYSHPIYIKNIVKNGAITSKIYGCSQDIEKVYIKTEEKHEKDKILVNTYRIYLDEENNKIREELISNSKYKLK